MAEETVMEHISMSWCWWCDAITAHEDGCCMDCGSYGKREQDYDDPEESEDGDE